MKSKNVIKLLKGTMKYFVPALFCTLFYTLFKFLIPQIVGVTVDNVIGTLPAEGRIAQLLLDLGGGRQNLRDNLIFCAIAIGICALAEGVCNYFSRINVTRGTEKFTMVLRNILLAHIESLPFSWHTKNSTGDIIQRSTADVMTLRNFISSQLIEVIKTLILLTVALVIMFSMNTKLALVFFVTVPLIVIYSLLFHTRISRQFRSADEAEGELLTQVQENLSGMRVVRAFGRERHELDKFNSTSDKYVKNWVDLGYTLGFFWGIGDLATCIQLMSVICAGAFFAAKGELSLGTLLIFISYTQSLAGPVRSLGKSLSELSKAGVSAERIEEILSSPPEKDEDDALNEGFGGDIVFDNVSFSYGENEVLSHLSFTVAEGSTLGILGTTGSGKSSLTYLLNRLYEPSEGQIRIGGKDIRSFKKSYLRRNIGLVLQDSFLFSKTIAENIAIAAEEADIDKIRSCAHVASVDSDISTFPDAYDTMVGERGVTLSGGQRQRIAIARTLMQHCPVMIFDDSLSAVDMETDARIRESLRQNTKNATVFLISHRINTLMDADKIIVLDEGRIVEEGTHRDLIAKGGLYSRVCEIQSMSAKEVDADE
ncbi:MAG: ABC transporter ATP-binding protein [Ruminococcaceae bacterium]|nr:ABC transporter ATP-binding protein [Oscillospiraceae bacterium]